MPLPNDILSVFPICILGAIACSLGLAFCEIQALLLLLHLSEWYFFPTFNLLRVIPDKLLGLLSLVSIPLLLVLACSREYN